MNGSESVRRTVRRAYRVLVLADEWFAARGGLSALSRYVSLALVKAGAEVLCVVPSACPDEHEDAGRAGVHLISAPHIPNGPDLHALLRTPSRLGGYTPDVIIGHGRVTGGVAKVLAEHYYKNAARLHFVHVVPDELEWSRSGRESDVGTRAEERTRDELDLALGAACVVAVGPRVYQWLRRDLSVLAEPPKLVQLVPGFDGAEQRARRPPEGKPLILFMGRAEDPEVKGLDLAAKAVGDAMALLGGGPELELLVRGAPQGRAASLHDDIVRWSGCPSLHVTVRHYSTDRELLQQDLYRASLVLMPSRAEGFGLVGLEAIAAGTPVLVSERSGLAMLLRDVLSAEQVARIVVPVRADEGRDVPQWSSGIFAVLRDRRAAFCNAADVQCLMAHERTWAMAAEQLLHSASAGSVEPDA